uniref:Uncharacterized protein n=2 Tax=Chromera velia CCMP2878 TaxID=1169474 RepID=A0A0K6S8G9_9ALVE|eukprot:Cvel_25019.t1-p1 / transcript=Cvel_25019.t1 / gene=Cvel_25019 / organism=Chromera_velia_CCMP2878 / gene_product=hypothetical protein / transcript_product=hypothetical protein / location=Cvel_scaffold2775:21192-23609(+) / protein_length=304 / sequence_SO=supercontig / SO=protein_coding / is_pseudo=false
MQCLSVLLSVALLALGDGNGSSVSPFRGPTSRSRVVGPRQKSVTSSLLFRFSEKEAVGDGRQAGRRGRDGSNTGGAFLLRISRLHPRTRRGPLMGGRTKLRMVWATPMFGDEPGKKRRKRGNRAVEISNYGPDKVTQMNSDELEFYEKHMYNSSWGNFFYVLDPGLGRFPWTKMTPWEAAGGVHIEPEAYEKIKNVIQNWTTPEGRGAFVLVGAKDDHYAFAYYGSMQQYSCITVWLKNILWKEVPGCKVSIVAPVSRRSSKLSVFYFLCPSLSVCLSFCLGVPVSMSFCRSVCLSRVAHPRHT